MLGLHKDNLGMTQARRLSQFFTNRRAAAKLVQMTQQWLAKQGVRNPMFVEPSAGDAAFFDALPAGRRVGVEVDPALVRKHGFVLTDLNRGGFLSLTARDLGLHQVPKSQIVVIGNPPYSQPRDAGRSKNIALDFVNHAAELGDTVVMILGNTFRRPTTQSKVARHMHLVLDRDVPSNLYTLDGKPHKVHTVFQIWQAKYDRQGRGVPRRESKLLSLVKNGEWGGDWRYVKSTDPAANVRICKWGSHATVGRVDGPAATRQKVQENRRKYAAKQRQGGRTSFNPDQTHYYIAAAYPEDTVRRFRARKHLFEALAKDRTMGNNPDLTLADMVAIFLLPPTKRYVNGHWV